ncbi:RCR-like protein [Microdochium nivale]|nr:RCR-like protein [Microdochium nivale]
MAPHAISALLGRDDDFFYGDSFWYSREGVIVKWVLFFAFITFFTVYFFGGRGSARRRVRNNKKPFFGTAWLLSRRERGLVDPRYAAGAWPGHNTNGPYYHYSAHPGQQQQGYYGGQQQYPMGDVYAPPPPVYDGHRPPVYEAGAAPGDNVGGAKIDPNQTSGVGPAAPGPSSGTGGANYFAPPPGPPPAR